MLRRIGYITKCIVFLSVLIMCLYVANKILIKKDYYNAKWPVTTTANDFYHLKENTMEVLSLGSSRSITGFIPQEMYDNYGITSFNLGTPQQNLLLSYFWLKEALKTQKPKVVFLEITFLYDYYTESPLNSTESCIRMGIDFMRMGDVKREAIEAICKADPSQSRLSFYLQNIRYHERWTDLGEEDFSFAEMEKQKGMKGFSALTSVNKDNIMKPFEADESEGGEEPLPLMKEYLDKIVELCKENDIQLVLTMAPGRQCSIKKYNTVKAYSEENGLYYIDFAEKSVYESSGIIMNEDMADKTHSNYKGAKKITDYLGEFLIEELHIEPRVDEQWNVKQSNYTEVMENCRLIEITDLEEYLSVLDKPRYTVFISVRGDITEYLSKYARKAFKKLQLKKQFYKHAGMGYCAVIDGDFFREEMGEDPISYEGVFGNGKSGYQISSLGENDGNICSILIDGKEYAKNKKGINIVVYDNMMKAVVDSVAFDTSVENIKVYR